MQTYRALAAQLLGIGMALVLARMFALTLPVAVALQAVSAVIASRMLRQPTWWAPIHLLFLPAAFALLTLHLPAWLYLLILLLLALVFWGTVKGDVPLFLSSPPVAAALEEIIAREQAGRLAELGAGVGSVAIPLAQRLPTLDIIAWEKAPLPWLLLAWRARRLHNVACRRSSFWEASLQDYDVVFAFLSPLVMPALKDKAQREMRPGTLLVSSSFAAPDWAPETVLTLNDARRTLLYCYRNPAP